jgi:hypothetical protein
MLADIVGSAHKGGANDHKFFRYRDDVIRHRFGIVCIRRPVQTALKRLGDPGYVGAEFMPGLVLPTLDRFPLSGE